MEKSLLLVISGPSGVGKGTIVKELLKRRQKLELSVSATTRAPRTGEAEGVNYYYKTREQFERMLEDDEFLESFEIYGNRYGTPKRQVLKQLASGIDVVLEIDIQGGMEVKRKYPDAVLIFILPPSVQLLYERLVGRQSESEQSLSVRTQAAVEEIKKCNFYDYAVLNDSVERAVCDIINIIECEKLKSGRNAELINRIIGGK